jgi:hypothetical protein
MQFLTSWDGIRKTRSHNLVGLRHQRIAGHEDAGFTGACVKAQGDTEGITPKKTVLGKNVYSKGWRYQHHKYL